MEKALLPLSAKPSMRIATSNFSKQLTAAPMLVLRVFIGNGLPRPFGARNDSKVSTLQWRAIF